MAFGSLWLPVVVAAVAVWIVSAIAHMLVGHHKADYKGLPDEEAASKALRGVAPGFYMLPHCGDPSRLKDPAVIKRFEQGPVAQIAIMRPGPPTLGKHLMLWLGFCLLVSFVSAYVARVTLTPASAGMLACRVTGTVAFAAYGVGLLHESIWRGIPWANTLRGVVDAAVYAVVTGLVFLLLWPAA